VTAAPARLLLKSAGFFAVLAALILVLHLAKPDTDSLSRFVDEYVRARGLQGAILYVLLTGLLVCTGVPRQLLAFFGGYVYGAIFGALWATVGVTLGCALSFGCSRLLGRDFAQRRFGRRIGKLENFLLRAPFTMTFIVRSLPVGNNLATNILAGVTRIPALPFFAGSFLGYLPQHFIFSLLGSGVHVEPLWRTAVSAALFLLSSLLGFLLYRRYHATAHAI
jgi:uncharacterized membrane protein YdjX (TVP38/TMEM64 family)